MFWQEILDGVNEVLEIMQTTPGSTEDESDRASAEACTPFQQKTVSILVGLRIMFEKVLKFEDQLLLCPEDRGTTSSRR